MCGTILDDMDVIANVREALAHIQDPELGFSIVALGLIYNVEFDADSAQARVTLTLTTPFCPLQDRLRSDITAAVMAVAGVRSVDIVLVFDPPWSAQMATLDVQQQFVLKGIPLTR